MTGQSPFSGIQPVLQMPFGQAPVHRIEVDELTALVQALLGSGVDGVVVPGLASESWALTESERDQVVDVAATALAGHARLIVGIDGATLVAADRARRAARLGAAGVMCLPPREAQGADALVRHFDAVADAGGLPLLMQDAPQVSGVTMDVAVIVSAARANPLVSSLKAEVPGSGAKISAAHGEGVEIVAGWGGIGYLEQVERGAVGCMPGSDLGPALLAIDRALRARDIDEAGHRYRQILPLLTFETASLSTLILSAKRCLRRRGIFSTALMREPARAFDPLEETTLDRLLDELEVAGVPGFEGLAPAGRADA